MGGLWLACREERLPVALLLAARHLDEQAQQATSPLLAGPLFGHLSVMRRAGASCCVPGSETHSRASSQSFSMIHRRMVLPPLPASPVNSGESLKTIAMRLARSPLSSTGCSFDSTCSRNRQRAVVRWS